MSEDCNSWDVNEYWLDKGIDIDARRLDLNDDIEDHSVGIIIRALHKLEELDPRGPIYMYVNSCGGDIYAGLALYDTMRQCSAPITVYGRGKVMSMGTIILLGGDHRFAFRNTTFMWHSASSFSEGKIFEMIGDVKETQRLFNVMMDIYAERAGNKASWWKRWLKYEDRYGDVWDAVDLGFITDCL